MAWELESDHGSWSAMRTDDPATETVAALALPGSWQWFLYSDPATVLVRHDQIEVLTGGGVPRVTAISPVSLTPTAELAITGSGFNSAINVRFMPTTSGPRGVIVAANTWISSTPTSIVCYAVGGIAGLSPGYDYVVDVENSHGWSSGGPVLKVT